MAGKIIATLISLIAIISAAFTVDGTYMRRAEAKDQLEQGTVQMLKVQRDLSIKQERGEIENKLQVISLELEFLIQKSQNPKLSVTEREELKERKQYLRKRQEILESRLLELEDKK